MDDEDLKSKLAGVLGRAHEATRKEQDNRARVKEWIREQGRPTFDRLQRILNEIGVQDATNRWDNLVGTVSFGDTGNGFTYVIELTASPKGVTGTTHIRVPGQEERTHGPVKDIVRWAQDQIVDDFLKGLDSWHPEMK
jgi:hypothetical protein